MKRVSLVAVSFQVGVVASLGCGTVTQEDYDRPDNGDVATDTATEDASDADAQSDATTPDAPDVDELRATALSVAEFDRMFIQASCTCDHLPGTSGWDACVAEAEPLNGVSESGLACLRDGADDAAFVAAAAFYDCMGQFLADDGQACAEDVACDLGRDDAIAFCLGGASVNAESCHIPSDAPRFACE